MIEIKVGSWWRSRFTGKIATVIAVRNDLVTALWPDGSSGYVTTKIFLKDFKHLPHCTGFDWVPVSRWFVPTRGGFLGGTLVVEQDQYGKVFAHSADEGRSEELTVYQHGLLDKLVQQKDWCEIPEPEAAAILEKARKSEPKERYYQNPSGFKNGTLFCRRDKEGYVWSILSGGQKRLHGKWREHHDRYVTQGLWVEVTEDFVNRTLDANWEESYAIPEKPDFPEQENSPKQENAKPTFWHVKLGNGDVSTYYGSSVDGKCVMLIRREEHGLEPGTMVNFDYNKKFPKLQADDILIEGSPAMFGILSRAIGLCASNTALRRNAEAKTCSGCDCGV